MARTVPAMDRVLSSTWSWPSWGPRIPPWRRQVRGVVACCCGTEVTGTLDSVGLALPSRRGHEGGDTAGAPIMTGSAASAVRRQISKTRARCHPTRRGARTAAGGRGAPSNEPSARSDGSRPPTDGSRPPPHGSRPPPHGSRPPADGSRPPADGSRPRPHGSRPPADGSRPPADGPRPRPHGSRPPADGSRPRPVGSPPKKRHAHLPGARDLARGRDGDGRRSAGHPDGDLGVTLRRPHGARPADAGRGAGGRCPGGLLQPGCDLPAGDADVHRRSAGHEAAGLPVVLALRRVRLPQFRSAPGDLPGRQ